MASEQSTKIYEAARDRIEEAARRGGEIRVQIISQDMFRECLDGRYESPIEAVFQAWWYALEPYISGRGLDLIAQLPVSASGESFRLDFSVSMPAHPGSYGSNVLTPYPLIAIELDGHDFHERTKEQVTHRNHRDRCLQGAGWKVFHVSGSELFRQPEQCVGDIIEIAHLEWASFWQNYWFEVNKKNAAEREAANK